MEFCKSDLFKGLGDEKKSNIIQFNNSAPLTYYVLAVPIAVKNNNSTNNSKTFPKFVYSNELFYTPGYNPVVGSGSQAPKNGSGKIGIRAGDACNWESTGRPIPPPSVIISPSDVGNVLKNVSSDNLILCNLDLFAYEEFREYARTLSAYEDFMIALKNKIDADKGFRKKTRRVPNFNYGFGLFKKWSEFHEFVAKECDRINKERAEREFKRNEFNRWQKNQPRLSISNHATELHYGLYSKGYDHVDKVSIDRYKQRSKALEKTIANNGVCFDYSSQVAHPNFTDGYAGVFNNCYGTELDKQLHTELCQTRVAMVDLQTKYVDDFHVKIFAPLVYQTTAKAKIETDPEKAFILSDFSYDLVRIVTGGVNLLKNGACRTGRAIVNGVKTSFNSEHWKNMALGVANLISLASQNNEFQERLDNTFGYGVVTGNYESYLNQNESYEKFHRAIGQALKQEVKREIDKLKKMSWGDIYENGIYSGVVLGLDGVIINFATLAASNVGCELAYQMADIFNSPFAEEFAIEAAGIGKITLEEGVDVANMAIEIVDKNPKLLSSREQSAIGTLFEVVEDIKDPAGTVWDFIKMTDPMYANTRIPKSFEITVGKQKLWVAPNATKHLWEYVVRAKEISHGMPMNSQSLLRSFKASVEKVIEGGIQYTQRPIIMDSWELMFSPPRSDGLLPVVKHAMYKPKGF